ncbi:MAG: capsular biosynthesis protein [Bacteroidia bacterium]|nr:capsular biosynthesis protein [Bacteroidia bacterium]
MFSIFKSKPKKDSPSILIDIHSHLLPAIDDGAKTMEEAWQIIRTFEDLGYVKLNTTPHIMNDFYRNTPLGIQTKKDQLTNFLKEKYCSIQIEAAAEYYLDESLLQSVENNEALMTFGNQKYLLFETNFLTEPYPLKDFIFKITTKGYKPVLAHPERYEYLHKTFDKLEDLRNRGVLFQLNLLSLIGFYSIPIQRMAESMIDKGWVDFIGSDCHNTQYSVLIEKAQRTKYFKKALDLPLLNNSL